MGCWPNWLSAPTAALELLLELGIDEAAAYVDGLVVGLLAGIDRVASQ